MTLKSCIINNAYNGTEITSYYKKKDIVDEKHSDTNITAGFYSALDSFSLELHKSSIKRTVTESGIVQLFSFVYLKPVDKIALDYVDKSRDSIAEIDIKNRSFFYNPDKPNIVMFYDTLPKNSQEQYKDKKINFSELEKKIIDFYKPIKIIDFQNNDIVLESKSNSNKLCFTYIEAASKLIKEIDVKNRTFYCSPKNPKNLLFFDTITKEMQENYKHLEIDYSELEKRFNRIKGPVRFMNFGSKDFVLKAFVEKKYVITNSSDPDFDRRLTITIAYDKEDELIESRNGLKLVPWAVDSIKKIISSPEAAEPMNNAIKNSNVSEYKKTINPELERVFNEYEILRERMRKEIPWKIFTDIPDRMKQADVDFEIKTLDFQQTLINYIDLVFDVYLGYDFIPTSKEYIDSREAFFDSLGNYILKNKALKTIQKQRELLPNVDRDVGFLNKEGKASISNILSNLASRTISRIDEPEIIKEEVREELKEEAENKVKKRKEKLVNIFSEVQDDKVSKKKKRRFRR